MELERAAAGYRSERITRLAHQDRAKTSGSFSQREESAKTQDTDVALYMSEICEWAYCEGQTAFGTLVSDVPGPRGAENPGYRQASWGRIRQSGVICE